MILNRTGWACVALIAAAAIALYSLKHWYPDCKRFEVRTVEVMNHSKFGGPGPTRNREYKVCIER